MNNYDKKSRNKLIKKITKGFTIVELLVIIAIIGVMSTIGIASFSNIQSNARNTQRSSKITILSEALEKYYDINGEYPSCAAMTASSDTVTSTTLKGLDPDALTSPTGTKGINSISCVDSPSPDGFAYVGGVNQYTLKYKEEDSSNILILDSRRHVNTTTYTLAINAGAGGTVNAGGTYNDGTSQTITATPNTYYSFSSWSGSTGCSGGASSSITMDANKTCTANFTPIAITAPTTPVVAANTVGATTTFSWGAASCPGNTARYQYRYTISPSGYDSGLVATAATSVAFTSSTEAQTYTVATQAECYNAATASGMSAAGSASYYRPITQYTLTIVAGTGGTVNAGGTYNTGTIRTITATPSTNYSFSSWTGSTGCVGVASHTITMDANKTCTANFTPTAIAAPATPTVTANTVTTTTTFSWGAASCPGNTARYQYRHTISPSGYDSGLVATAATSVAFTTSTGGQTYTVAVQAQCYNGVTTSSWSSAGTVSYYRPIVQVLVVAGGGGGGTGGGGGGGVVIGPITLDSGSTSVTVGAGGAASSQGGNSVFQSITAYGGGTGGGWMGPGGGGGSTGGGGHSTAWTWPGIVQVGTGGTAYGEVGGGNGGIFGPHWPTGGGGGAGGVGQHAPNMYYSGNGGLGISSSISGIAKTYAAGGGGGMVQDSNGPGFGTWGVSGDGAVANRLGCYAGWANTGGGGGGGSDYIGSCAGGSGIIIVSYPTGTMSATGGTITTSGGNTIHTFTSSGNFTVL